MESAVKQTAQDLDNFKKKFNFQEEKKLFVGVERECHLVNSEGSIVPMAFEVLTALGHKNFGYELSACQLESRTEPVRIECVRDALLQNDNLVYPVLEKLSLWASHREVAPLDMPLDVYPDPTGRYQQITQNMPVEILRAACRVIGTHVHIGMPNHCTALNVYNKVISSTEKLMNLGDGSNGERLAIYRIMAPDAMPKAYKSWEDFYSMACVKGFEQDPRKCWTLVRISIHGTIEFRMFGTTSDVDVITGWARRCHQLCADSMS